MKKYISIVSVFVFFLSGINVVQAQELERRSLDESKGKDKEEVVRKANEEAKEQRDPEVQAKQVDLREQEADETSKNLTQQLQDYVSLDKEQGLQAHKVYLDMTLKLMQIEDDGSDKYQNAVSDIESQANQKMMKILDDEQIEQYNMMLEKLAKSDK